MWMTSHRPRESCSTGCARTRSASSTSTTIGAGASLRASRVMRSCSVSRERPISPRWITRWTVWMRFARQVLQGAEPLLSQGRRIVVFGDMLELGDGEMEAHREIGGTIAAAGPALVIGVGPLARVAIESVTKTRGTQAIETLWFPTSAQAAAEVAGQIRPGDIILVKGSRGVALERIVNALKERFGEE